MNSKKEWQLQADAYETAQVKADSLDTLVEYPAQLKAIGDVTDKVILDIACGSGRKALDWIRQGAKAVYAFDLVDSYARPWPENQQPDNLHIFQCDLNAFDTHAMIQGVEFDLVTSLQAAGYPQDPTDTYRKIHAALKPGGRFIYTTAHPMRYAAERYIKSGIQLAEAYHDASAIEYQGVWCREATTSSQPMTISRRINSLIEVGFILEEVQEPFMSDKDAAAYPHKYAWMQTYFGMILYKLRAADC